MVKAFPAGSELDALIAQKVMLWEGAAGGWQTQDHRVRAPESFQPSRNLHHAAELLRYLEAHWSPATMERFHAALAQLTSDHDAQGHPPRLSASALEQLPEFVCRAALVAQLLHRL